MNNDTRAHTVTETTEKFDSGNITQGKTFSHTFNTTGNYNYFDKNDPKDDRIPKSGKYHTGM